MYNSGYADLARRQAQHTIGVFAGDEPVVVPSGSCAAMVKAEFPHLFADDGAWRSRAADLAARTFELSDFLVNRLGVSDVGARYDGSVTYHYACHLRAWGSSKKSSNCCGTSAGRPMCRSPGRTSAAVSAARSRFAIRRSPARW